MIPVASNRLAAIPHVRAESLKGVHGMISAGTIQRVTCVLGVLVWAACAAMAHLADYLGRKYEEAHDWRAAHRAGEGAGR